MVATRERQGSDGSVARASSAALTRSIACNEPDVSRMSSASVAVAAIATGDFNGDGKVDRDEFKAWVKSILSE